MGGTLHVLADELRLQRGCIKSYVLHAAADTAVSVTGGRGRVVECWTTAWGVISPVSNDSEHVKRVKSGAKHACVPGHSVMGAAAPAAAAS